MRLVRRLGALALTLLAVDAGAQAISTARLAILLAENRRAPTPGDLLTIRNGARARDPETVRLAVRALGRLERPALIPDLIAALQFPEPNVRAEAANAVAQAAQGWKSGAVRESAAARTSLQATLIARLADDGDASVRAALCEAIARIPYREVSEFERAERALAEAAERHDTTTDRLGVAKGLEVLVRLQQPLRLPGDATVARLKELARERPAQDPSRDARVRRLAMEALVGIAAADEQVTARAAADLDPQVRRLAIRAAAASGLDIDRVKKGLSDPAAVVRLEALRAIGPLGTEPACALSLHAAADPELAVAVAALDQLAACSSVPAAVALLARTVNDLSEAGAPRGWHRSAHALIALASADPERATASLPQVSGSSIWQLRMAAARAAAAVKALAVTEQLAMDSDDRVANVALRAMGAAARPPRASDDSKASTITTGDLRRLAAPRARITIRDLGRFDLALFTAEAPFTVARFAELAEAGYYNGLAIDRPAADNMLRTGGSGSGTALRDEVGLWPHVRGATGIVTSGRDTGTGDFFVDLIDSPQRDHESTVFGQVLNGIDIVDQILDGDVIESVEIIP